MLAEHIPIEHNLLMVEVVVTDEFTVWYDSLSDVEAAAVAHVVTLLEMHGVSLGHPYCSAINGASFALRELRVSAGRSPLRAFYAFDPSRQAVVLCAGDKSGNNQFYAQMITAAERIWAEYLKETSQCP
jgi:hypothetical protein